MHVIAHGDCTDTVRQSATEAMTLGEKSLASPGTRTRIRVAPGFSAGRSISWAASAPGKTHNNLLQLIRGTTICYRWYETRPFVTADTRHNHLLQLTRGTTICYRWYEVQPFVTADTRHNHLLQLSRDTTICYSWYETQPFVTAVTRHKHLLQLVRNNH